MIRAGLAALLVTCALAGCTSAPTPEIINDTTIDSTVTSTVPPSTSGYTPPPALTVTPLPPGFPPRPGEVEGGCPYISSLQVQNIVGSHVARTTMQTGTVPEGCRFYFYAPPYQAIADIVFSQLDSHTAAYNAAITLARAGTDATGKPSIAPGVDAVLFRTQFFGPDGARDWACAFAVGKALVVVHTDRFDTSFPALELARVIASKL